MKRLVIAPHVDDDVLGCASVLGPDTVTFYCGVDESGIDGRPTVGVRYGEALAVLVATGGRLFFWPGTVFLGDPSRTYFTYRKVNEYDERSLVRDLERVINDEQPSEVYIPWPSYNQDHRAVYEAALVALRPHDRNWFVPRVLVYEGSQINFWDHANPGVQFQPNYFVPLDFERKATLVGLMASQVRAMRSPAQLEALARLRGGEIGVPHAEAFKVLRWVGERDER